MSKLSGAIYDIRYLDEIATISSPIHSVHPVIKLLVTMIYIWVVISIQKYNILGIIPMFLYLVLVFMLSDVPFLVSIKKLRIVLPICILAGLFNPFFDHMPITVVLNITITGGIVSGLLLIIKGILTVFASYLLIATTGIEKLCYAFSMIHVPKILVTQILLTYRYITLLLTEANEIYQAYSLRAPNQKGIHFKVWGTLLGQLLFRTIDRADGLYNSMLLRCFHGEFQYKNKLKLRFSDGVYFVLWISYFFIVRYTTLLKTLGTIFI